MKNQETASPAYWDRVYLEKKERLRLDAWRAYMKSVYSRLIRGWFCADMAGVSLKTDLFEEACTQYSLISDMGSGAVGFDHSFQIAHAAQAKLGAIRRSGGILVCDLRRLPFLSQSIKQILSPSSLDHFSIPQDIDRTFHELGRVLAPKGVLILAMDNPHNPVVWIRNHLPFALLNRIGLVPYYIGPTCTLREAKSKLVDAGFEVTDHTAVAHVPRVPAIWLVMIAEMMGSARLERWLVRCFAWWDVLQRLPTRYRTGYYIALRAVRCQS